jgi:hypothetical protein
LLHSDAAFHAQFVGGFGEVEDGDGIIEDIVHPADAVGGLDQQAGGADLHVVPLHGPHHEAVRAELDGLAVAVEGAMFYFQQHNRRTGYWSPVAATATASRLTRTWTDSV